MNLHPPTLIFACLSVLLMAAAVMTWFGLHQPRYRGYWWWVGAQWMLLAGLAVQWMPRESELVQSAAHLLVLQWPLCVIAGLRRFYSRHDLPVSAALDLVLLAVTGAAVPLALLLRLPAAALAMAWCLASMVVQLYAALLVTRLSEFKGNPALQLLAIALGAAAAINGVRSFVPAEATGLANAPLLASSLVMLLPALVLVHMALMLNFRRTELGWLATQRKLRYLADMDVLTRVANRRHFQELATNSLVSIKAEDASILMFDIDHFRRINDMFGHAAGDEALRQVSQCMRETLREQDVAGRLGGDVFACLLPDTLPKGAMAVAARIVSNLSDRQVAPRIAPLSLSFGIVRLHENEVVADALRRAEQALHEAKRQGRSRVVVATGSSDKPVFTNSRTLGLINA